MEKQIDKAKAKPKPKPKPKMFSPEEIHAFAHYSGMHKFQCFYRAKYEDTSSSSQDIFAYEEVPLLKFAPFKLIRQFCECPECVSLRLDNQRRMLLMCMEYFHPSDVDNRHS